MLKEILQLQLRPASSAFSPFPCFAPSGSPMAQWPMAKVKLALIGGLWHNTVLTGLVQLVSFDLCVVGFILVANCLHIGTRLTFRQWEDYLISNILYVAMSHLTKQKSEYLNLNYRLAFLLLLYLMDLLIGSTLNLIIINNFIRYRMQ